MNRKVREKNLYKKVISIMIIMSISIIFIFGVNFSTNAIEPSSSSEINNTFEEIVNSEESGNIDQSNGSTSSSEFTDSSEEPLNQEEISSESSISSEPKQDINSSENVVVYETDRDILDSGFFGTCEWTLYSDGVLELGSGKIPDLPLGSSTSWLVDEGHGDDIVTIRLLGPVIAGESISGLFGTMPVLEEIQNIGYLDTSNTVYFGYVFAFSSKIKSLDLSSWNTQNVVYGSSMFSNCLDLDYLDISGWDLSKIMQNSSMFRTGITPPKTIVLGVNTLHNPEIIQDSYFPEIPIQGKYTGNWVGLNTQTIYNHYTDGYGTFFQKYVANPVVDTYVWQAAITATFKTDDDIIETQNLMTTDRVERPSDPTLEKHLFDGWYADKNLTTEWDFSTRIIDDVDIYAKWIELIDISGTKTWVGDNNNIDGNRPDSITVNLLADGVTINSQQVSSKTNWNYVFTNMPKLKNGNPIVYTITEDPIKNYSTEIDGTDIINHYTPDKRNISVTKVWIDENNKHLARTEFVEVQLFENGKETGNIIRLDKENNWNATWTDLLIQKNGKDIEYSIQEVSVPPGYLSSDNHDDIENIILYNKYSVSFPPTANNKKGKSPKTGDTSNLTTPIITISASTILLAGLGIVLYNKKKKNITNAKKN